MRKRLVTVAFGGLGALGLAAAATPGASVAEEVRRTCDVLLNARTSGPGEAHTALRRLIEIAGDLGREAHLAAAAQAKLDAAIAEARRLSPLDGAVRAPMLEAYAALDGRRPFAFPKEVGSIEQAKTYGRGQANRSLAALSTGRSQEAARELVGLVLLVIAPMEAPR
jgi:hypothetical protein